MASRYRAQMAEGTLWMVGLTVGLFFVPLVNGVVGGLVGGYRVGDRKAALGAAVLPAVVVALGMLMILALFRAPVIGVPAGGAVGTLTVLSVVGLFIGAAVGGSIAQSGAGRRHAEI